MTLEFSFACPLCGSKVEVQPATTIREFHPGYHVRGEPLPSYQVETTIAACTGCEFVLDLEYAERKERTEESLTAEIRWMVREVSADDDRNAA